MLLLNYGEKLTQVKSKTARRGKDETQGRNTTSRKTKHKKAKGKENGRKNKYKNNTKKTKKTKKENNKEKLAMRGVVRILTFFS